MVIRGYQLPAKITLDWLREHRACPPDIERFPRDFPDGHDLTLESLTRAAERNYDLYWLGDEILEEEAWGLYEMSYFNALDEVEGLPPDKLYHFRIAGAGMLFAAIQLMRQK